MHHLEIFPSTDSCLGPFVIFQTIPTSVLLFTSLSTGHCCIPAFFKKKPSARRTAKKKKPHETTQ